MAVLTAKWNAKWKPLPTSDGAVVTGTDGEPRAPAEKPLAAKPMFIYVTDGAVDGSFDKIEKVILNDNKVLVGMWAFNCIKMSTDEVNNDPLLSGKGDDPRRFIFVSRDYDDIKVIEGSRLKTKEVYDTMKKFASRDYSTSFEKHVKATLKLLIEFDKINNSRKMLDEKEKRLGADISKSDAAKIAKEKDELEARQKEADSEKARLLKFELKSA